MRLTHELISSDVVDMELIELKFVFDRSKQVRYSRRLEHSQELQLTMITVTLQSCLTISHKRWKLSTSKLNFSKSSWE